MTVFIKFIDGEEIIIEGANEYSSSHDSNNWKVNGKMEYLRSERT